jgi:hypothetical protein
MGVGRWTIDDGPLTMDDGQSSTVKRQWSNEKKDPVNQDQILFLM